jgi:hypothetical protein
LTAILLGLFAQLYPATFQDAYVPLAASVILFFALHGVAFVVDLSVHGDLLFTTQPHTVSVNGEENKIPALCVCTEMLSYSDVYSIALGVHNTDKHDDESLENSAVLHFSYADVFDVDGWLVVERLDCHITALVTEFAEKTDNAYLRNTIKQLTNIGKVINKKID